MLHTVAYVSFSGAGHRISRRNTGRYTKDPLCEQLFARIAQDENLHMVFYRNVLQAALELAPDETMRAIWDVVSTFQMPGNTIAGFTRRSVQIAMAGIYDLRIHRDEVLVPILRSWDVWDRVGLSAEGEQAREQLGGYFEELDRQAGRFELRRAARQARAEATPLKRSR
jgi:acyl-[acyl-carrier-protein] desaturase